MCVIARILWDGHEGQVGRHVPAGMFFTRIPCDSRVRGWNHESAACTALSCQSFPRKSNAARHRNLVR